MKNDISKIWKEPSVAVLLNIVGSRGKSIINGRVLEFNLTKNRILFNYSSTILSLVEEKIDSR